MDITAERIEDTFRYGGSLELPNGETINRDSLRQYIDACEIETYDDGTPHDDQWQILADVLGAPDPTNTTELIDITLAAADIALAEVKRDEAIRAALTAGHSAIAVANAASLSRARVYQIRDRRR